MCVSVCPSSRAIETVETMFGSLCSRRVVESSGPRLLGESVSPFIVEGDSLTSQRERESVYGRCLVLFPTPSGTGCQPSPAILFTPPSPTLLFMLCCIWQATQCSPSTVNDGAHNTVYALTRLAGCTVFAWYGKRWRPQYYLCSDVSSRLYRVRLVCLDGTILQVCRA